MDAQVLNTYVRDNLLVSEVKTVTTAGDMVKASAANVLARVAIGTAGQRYEVNSGAPAWRSIINPRIFPWIVSVTPAGGNNLNTNWNAEPGNPDLGGGTRLWYAADSGAGGALNDEATWYVLLGNGTWSMFVVYRKGPGDGSVSCRIDGTEVVALDMYAAALSTNNMSTTTGIAVGLPGRHSITLKVTAKNASSSGYAAKLSRIAFARTA